MRTTVLGVLAVALSALPLSAQTYGVGIGSAAPDSVMLRIDRKATTFELGTGASTPAAQQFLNCLVADRVIKVERSGKATRLTMLDKSEVAGHLREFLETKTATDPCALGKAAYTPAYMTAAPAAVSASADQPKAAEPKRLGRKAVAAEPATAGYAKEKTLGSSLAPARAAASPGGGAARGAQQDTVAPVMSTLPSAQTAIPSNAPTSRGLGTATTASTLPTSSPSSLPAAKAETPAPATPPAAPPTYKPPTK